ncbi:LysR family transcriptional regulator [Vibrio parahaemolyticus]|nr:LysR family transcriptional regulator [Vibrio parahaemolyticus]
MENNVNLNLIRTLLLLKKHKNMRTVAKILDKSESAISKDISKLNKEFAKELFIRTRNGFEPSYYLEQIFQELEFTYNKLIKLVNSPLEFNPKQYVDSINIAIAEAEYHQAVLYLYPKISQVFPLAKLNFITWDKDTLNDIKDGKIHGGIHFYDERLSKIIHQKILAKDSIVSVIHKRYDFDVWSEIKKLPFVFINVPGWNELNYRFKEVLPISIKNDISHSVKVDKLDTALSIASQKKIVVQIPMRYLNSNFKVIPYPDNNEFLVYYSFYCLQKWKNNPLVLIITNIVNEYYKESLGSV